MEIPNEDCENPSGNQQLLRHTAFREEVLFHNNLDYA